MPKPKKELDELKEKIDIILNNEVSKRKRGKKDKRYFWIPEPGESKIITRVRDIYRDFNATPDVLLDTKKISLSYPNLELLLKLYGSIQYSNELSSFFIGYLYKDIDDEYKGYLVSETLIKLGYMDKITGFIFPLNLSKLLPIFTVLDELLFFEYPLFSREQLDKIKLILQSVVEFKSFVKKEMQVYEQAIIRGNRIIQRIDAIYYDALALSLKEGTNFQINMDQEKIKEKIRIFGFDSILSDALDKIEELYWNTSIDEFDNSMAMDKLRTFWEKTVESICEKIYEKTGESYPKTEDTKIGNFRKYMKKHLQLDKENQLMNKLVDILNDKGSHNFISEREYFRLTKNITIEVAMLLFIKLEKFME